MPDPVVFENEEDILRAMCEKGIKPMMYVAKPVKVEAWRICQVNPLGFNWEIGRHETGLCEPGQPALIHLDDNSARHIDGKMTARYFPKPGDYLVKQEDGYVYINPKDVFERKYEPLVVKAESVNVHPPRIFATTSFDLSGMHESDKRDLARFCEDSAARVRRALEVTTGEYKEAIGKRVKMWLCLADVLRGIL